MEPLFYYFIYFIFFQKGEREERENIYFYRVNETKHREMEGIEWNGI